MRGFTIEKHIRDPIYGFITIPPDLKPFLDHKIVQRLRWVSQLPLEQLVYPSAMHSRFEHSIGAMHLAMYAADNLIRFSESRFKSICDNDSLIKVLKPSKRKEVFKLAAGLIALLHDIGHAPFSHTFEDVFKYRNNNNNDIKIRYIHEINSYELSEKIIKDINQINSPFVDLARTSLELIAKTKKINTNIQDLAIEHPVSYLLKKIIDGPIDVDKGDYVLRDSYHCGTNYGIYDYQRLWGNIFITSNREIGVLEKAATEAWGLRIARFKMHNNVYKHHVRNITDALLIEIINKMFELNNEEMLNYYPFLRNKDCIPSDKDLNSFISWNDQSFIALLAKILNSTDDAHLKNKIDHFMQRNLYKRAFSLDLADFDNLQVVSEDQINEFIIDLNEQKEKLINDYHFNFINYKQTLAPVFEKQVQDEIKVSIDNEEHTLAEVLGFSIPSKSQKKRNNHLESSWENFKEDRIIFDFFIEENQKNIKTKGLKEKMLNFFHNYKFSNSF